ncbi:MAG TPA: hypothetical protein VME47_14295 [Acetobacteraceae bacterium]|nr:hypothetical protein [Acetobacteraceae bacterium]
MAVIDRPGLVAITSETQRIVDVAKTLWGLQSQFAPNPDASAQLQQQINILLDAAGRISAAVNNAQ